MIVFIILFLLLLTLLIKTREYFDGNVQLSERHKRDIEDIVAEIRNNNFEKQMKYHALNRKVLDAQDSINYFKDNLNDYI